MTEETRERTPFERLTEAVRGAANLEHYEDASREEIDGAASEIREAFLVFIQQPEVRSLIGDDACDAADTKITDDMCRCPNCGTVDCENPDCDDD